MIQSNLGYVFFCTYAGSAPSIWYAVPYANVVGVGQRQFVRINSQKSQHNTKHISIAKILVHLYKFNGINELVYIQLAGVC